MISSILYCPSSRSHDPVALAKVVELADGREAQLTVFGVVPLATRMQRLFDRGGDVEAVQVAARQQLLDALAAATSGVDPDRLDVTVEVGRPAVAIIQRVLRSGHDLVVVNEPRSEVPYVKRLFRKCPCPVWSMRPASSGSLSRVVAAINPHPDETELNRRILGMASMMASEFDGELHVVHAWELYGAGWDSTLLNLETDEDFEQLRVQREAAHRQAVEDFLTSVDVGVDPTRVHVEQGPASEAILEVVRRLGADLLVLGTIARSGVDGVLIGNTAERVLDEARCSVVAVKPEGFVSPIHL